jgi:hypothetical protein
MAGILYNLGPTTSYDYGSLAPLAVSEVVHGPAAIAVVGGKEIVLQVRMTAKVVGTGSISVIVRQVFTAEDDAGDVTGTDIITLALSAAAPIGLLSTTTSNIPSHIRVLTKFTQGSSAGALLVRHMVKIIVRDQ